jgi:hypothetical protein
MIKSRRMRRSGKAADMQEQTGAYRVLVGKPEGKRPLERPKTDERIILKWIIEKQDGGMDWTLLA